MCVDCLPNALSNKRLHIATPSVHYYIDNGNALDSMLVAENTLLCSVVAQPFLLLIYLGLWDWLSG